MRISGDAFLNARLSLGDSLGKRILLLLLLGQCVDVKHPVLSLVGTALAVVDSLCAGHHTALLKCFVVALIFIKFALTTLHDFVNDIFDSGIVDSGTTDAVHAITNGLKSRLTACCHAGRYALLLKRCQAFSGRFQFSIHILALLLRQSKFCDFLLSDGYGSSVVALDRTKTVKHVVQVTASLNGCTKVLEEIAPVAIIQRIEEYAVSTFRTFNRSSPFIDTAFRLEEGIFCHLYGCSRNTNHSTKLRHLVDVQSELSGYGIERTCQTATAIDGLVDIVEL